MTLPNILLLGFAVLLIVTVLMLINQPQDLGLGGWERLI